MRPQELEYQRQKDLALLDTLRRELSDVSRPHRIEHHFITDSRAGGTELREWARLNGFEVLPLREAGPEGRRYYRFALIKTTMPTPEHVSADTSLMLHLAAEFECTYDGWHCEIVT